MNKINEITDIILDWNGTCVKSNLKDIVKIYINIAKREFGVDIDLQDVVARLKKENRNVLYDMILEQNSNKDYSDVKAVVDKELSTEIAEFPLFDGLDDILNLQDRGIKVHVVTMNFNEFIIPEMKKRNLLSRFDSVLGRNKELCKSEIAKKVGSIDFLKAIVIGDTDEDVIMAKDLGCWIYKIGETDFNYDKLIVVKNLGEVLHNVKMIIGI